MAGPAGRTSAGWIPLPTTSSHGRELEVELLAARLGEVRLLTLLGPGGVGKTRLALELASSVADRYPDGVHLVELGSIEPGADLAAAVGSALGIQRRAGGTTDERLVEYLALRRALLVLDECEGLLEPAAILAEALLVRSRGIDLLATSREPLGIQGEQLWPVACLATGDGDGPAVSLFADRAAAAAPGFELGDHNRSAVARICRQLDGLPLAIELAASRLRVTGLDELVASLDDHTGALRSSRRTGPLRHRSLEAVVEWSYERSTPEERILLGRLSVFAAGFDARAATAVAGGDGLAPEDLIGTLWGLVDRSLLVHEPRATSSTYRMLTTIRAYVRARLEDEGSLPATEARHTEWVVQQVAAADAALRGRGGRAGIEWFESYLPDVRAVHQRLRAAADRDRHLLLATCLHWYVFGRAHSEVYDWIYEAATAGYGDHPLLPAVLGSAGAGRCDRGDLEGARLLAQRGVDLAAELAHPPGASRAYDALADVALFEGDDRSARTLFATSRQLVEGDPPGPDVVYPIVGEAMALAYGGRDQGTAELLSDEALAVAARSGNDTARAWALYAAGEVRLEVDPDRSLGLLEAAVDVARKLDDRFLLGVAGLSAVTIRARAGDGVAARGMFADLLEHWRRAGAWTQQWVTVRNLVVVLIDAGDHRTAVQLYGAAEVSASSVPPYGAEAVRLEAAMAAARAALGPAAFAAEIAMGRMLGDEDAVDLALKATRADTTERTGSDEPDARPPAPPAEGVLHHEGDTWAVGFGGRTVRVRHSKGIGDLAALLATPGAEVHCLELIGGADVGGDAGTALDDRARRRYQERIRELQEEIDETRAANDWGRADRAEQELDALVQQLSEAFGLSGRARPTGSSAERARTAVTARLRSTIRRLAALDPPLGRHLENAVRTGTWCSYRPDNDVRWDVRT